MKIKKNKNYKIKMSNNDLQLLMNTCSRIQVPTTLQLNSPAVGSIEHYQNENLNFLSEKLILVTTDKNKIF
jgi:hypothetical protein